MAAYRKTTILVLALLMCSPFLLITDDTDGAAETSVVTFQGNGGAASDGRTTVAYNITTGNVIELPTQIFTRDGYYLSGFTEEKSTGRFMSAGSDYTVANDVKLLAKWEKLPSGTFIEKASKTGSMGTVYSFSPFTEKTLSELQSSDKDWFYMFQAMRNVQNLTYTPVSVPTWLHTDIEETKRSAFTYQYTLTFEGSPATPGNYLVHIQQTSSVSSSNSRDFYWMINVPSAGDGNVKLDYNANGGSPISKTEIQPQGTAVTLLGEGSTTKSGHTLVGWTLPDGKGAYPVYALDSVYTLSGDAEAVAKWVSDPDVLVYSMDGGSLKDVEAYVIYNHDTVTLHDHGVSKDGYTFLGWRPSNDHDIAYAPGLTIRLVGSNYLEAYFVPEGTETYKVTYNPNGGTGNIGSQTVESGMWVKLPEYGFVRSEHTFKGWATSPTSDEILDPKEFKVASDVTLYAVWEKNSSGTDPEGTHTVIFDPNGAQQSVDIQYITHGGVVDEPTGLMADGKVFKGWLNLETGEQWDFVNNKVETDLLLRAIFEDHFTIKTDGLKVTVTMLGKYAALENVTINWGDGSSDPITETSIHEYKGTISGYIVVTSSYDSVTSETSRMPFAVQGTHIPGYPSVDPDPDNPNTPTDPEHPTDPTVKKPVANFVIIDNKDGTYTFDASRSTDAKTYSWVLDGNGIGSTKTITVKVLSEGEHIVKLTVKNSVGDANSKDDRFTVNDGGEDDDKKKIDARYIIAGLVIVLILILILMRVF